jgi:PD-(D/E)XK endonuclease
MLLSVLTTNQKGLIAETAIVHAAVNAGIEVSRPLGDARYDLIFDLGTELVRVQCKWASRQGDVVAIRCRTCRRGPAGLVHGRYTAAEVDAFAAFCADLGRCFYIPFEAVGARSNLQLRLAPARNNQQIGIHWADDFDFERLHWDGQGAIAQLGER